MSFMELLQGKWDEGKYVCVGLDPDFTKIPDHIKTMIDGPAADVPIQAIENFCFDIIDATYDVVAAYKPNAAFFERYGWKGVQLLEDLVAYIKQTYSDVPVILDAKRGDIGNTNDGYVEAAFGQIGADAITVHPYMGQESLRPFLDRADKGIFVLCRTSNPGAGEFQDEDLGSAVLYERVAMHIADSWNVNGNCAVVVGATAPDELAAVRKLVGDIPILIPGVGAQGGKIEDVVPVGINSAGQGILINLSRNVLYASGGEDFTVAARLIVEESNDAILAAGAKGA
jgi:orotidine-5'-phosphate decarboxylase